ncbi:hypothetical protein H0H87_008975 [Tephrocybe sp. NHM501043]|nr:hypothetical protein H0H87_008975 [Tephrocybe sp. NHM501043]
MFPAENDVIERDVFGIPTVELRIKHDTDTCKTETKRKRRVETSFKATPGVPGVRKEWWEIWEENEELKRTGPYNPRVFTELEIDRPLKRSLAIIELARKELPLTSKIAKQIPDEFSKACVECFGRKSEGYKPIDPIFEADRSWGKETTDMPHDTPQDELDANRPKIDNTEVSSKTAADKFEEELKAANVEVIKVDEDVIMKDAEQLQVIKDNLNPDIDALPVWAKIEGWGSEVKIEGWGTDAADVDPWMTPTIDWDSGVGSSLLPFIAQPHCPSLTPPAS